jgi:alkaline phosphatase
MLDNAVKIAKDFAAEKNDTLVIVVADHGHPVSIVGTYDDDALGADAREKLGLSANSKFPNYPSANADGYPGNVDPSRRLAFTFGAFPDYCALFHPYLDGENMPEVKGPDGKASIVNEKYCSQPLATRREGNLPRASDSGVHSADDVVLTAIGPGAEQFHGRIDNTRVFRTMVSALGLGPKSSASIEGEGTAKR